MVPDVFQIIVKEKGVFTNVTSPSTKAKLRILFEVAPLALMVEQAGGASSCDGECVSALDIPILGYDQRTEICFGSIGEVRRFEEYLYGEPGSRKKGGRGWAQRGGLLLAWAGRLVANALLAALLRCLPLQATPLATARRTSWRPTLASKRCRRGFALLPRRAAPRWPLLAAVGCDVSDCGEC